MIHGKRSGYTCHVKTINHWSILIYVEIMETVHICTLERGTYKYDDDGGGGGSDGEMNK